MELPGDANGQGIPRFMGNMQPLHGNVTMDTDDSQVLASLRNIQQQITYATENSMTQKLTNKHPVMYLNELRKGLTYTLVREEDSGKEKTFTMSVTVDGQPFYGSAKNKKHAKQEAARSALLTVFNVTFVPDLEEQVQKQEAFFSL